jgi:hypothetical protein
VLVLEGYAPESRFKAEVNYHEMIKGLKDMVEEQGDGVASLVVRKFVFPDVFFETAGLHLIHSNVAQKKEFSDGVREIIRERLSQKREDGQR